VTGQWFSPGTPVSSTNKADRHDITEVLLRKETMKNKEENKACAVSKTECFIKSDSTFKGR
jgi:hypothetical protein